MINQNVIFLFWYRILVEKTVYGMTLQFQSMGPIGPEGNK